MRGQLSFHAGAFARAGGRSHARGARHSGRPEGERWEGPEGCDLWPGGKGTRAGGEVERMLGRLVGAVMQNVVNKCGRWE